MPMLQTKCIFRPMGKGSSFPLFKFHSKKQLAREGSQSVSPVIIPALTTFVDRQFKEDRTLCPVRALRYYLDRTQEQRDVRSLLFISFKKGHTSDQVPYILGKRKLSSCVSNEQINKPWTWPRLKLKTLGPSRPLKLSMVGFQWTKSCKLVTGRCTTLLETRESPILPPCCITAERVRAKFQLKEGSCVLHHYLHHLSAAGAATKWGSWLV